MATKFPFALDYAAVAASVVRDGDADLIQRLVRSMLAKGYPANTDAVARAFEPSWMYEDGTQGCAWSAARPETLHRFHDSVSPVSASGQTVKSVKDLSGHNNHILTTSDDSALTFSTAGGKYSLQGLGILPVLATAAVNLSAYDKVTMFLGSSPASAAATSAPCVVGSTTASLGGFFIQAPPTVGVQEVEFGSTGTTTITALDSTLVYPSDNILVGEADLAAPFVRLRRNKVQVANSTASQGGGTYGTWTYSLGAQPDGSKPFGGRLYAGGFIMKHLSTGYRNVLEAWLHAQTHDYTP